MITTKPYFYDSFKCTASACNDSCCIGWEIEIDETSLARFKNEKGDLGKKLNENINKNSFILSEDERCPFLKSNGLCELICQKGGDYICDICREHPRYHEWYGEYTDSGLGLCCDEACRLTFYNEKTITFITEGETTEVDEEINELLHQRKEIYKLITNRELPLSERLDCSVEFSEIRHLLNEFEPFDEEWTVASKYIKDNFDLLISKKGEYLSYIGKRVYEYEHLAIYLLHRYFMKSLYQYFPKSVIRGIGIYLGIQFLFDLYIYEKRGRFDFCDRIDSAKYISKQLEYSEENIDIIMNY